jgi:hypothetical protein
MQSAAASAGAGDESTAAPPTPAATREASRSRRDWSTNSLGWFETVVGGLEFVAVFGDVQLVDFVPKNENPSADKSRIAITNRDKLASSIIVKYVRLGFLVGALLERERLGSNDLQQQTPFKFRE